MQCWETNGLPYKTEIQFHQTRQTNGLVFYMEENKIIEIKPNKESPIWVVQSLTGRDRKRVFLAFRWDTTAECTQAAAECTPASLCNAGTHGNFPSVYTVNGTLRRVECPKKKHLAHVKVIGTLTAPEKDQLFSGYSNKTVADLVAKYDVGGELSKIREKNENSH